MLEAVYRAEESRELESDPDDPRISFGLDGYKYRVRELRRLLRATSDWTAFRKSLIEGVRRPSDKLVVVPHTAMGEDGRFTHPKGAATKALVLRNWSYLYERGLVDADGILFPGHLTGREGGFLTLFLLIEREEIEGGDACLTVQVGLPISIPAAGKYEWYFTETLYRGTLADAPRLDLQDEESFAGPHLPSAEFGVEDPATGEDPYTFEID